MNIRLFKVGLIVISISSCSNKTVQESLLTIDTLLQNKADTLLTTYIRQGYHHGNRYGLY